MSKPLNLIRWVFLLVILTGVSLGNPYHMDLKAPITRWDEAVPLGNGLLGGLLWGHDDEIRLSLDRGDLWDLRPHPTYQTTGFNYSVVKKYAQAGKAGDLNRKYSKGNRFPTKLPGGRLVLTLAPGQAAKMFHLDMKTAVGSVDLGKKQIKCFFSATPPVAFLKVPGKLRSFDVLPNKAVNKLGYKPARLKRNQDSAWFIQDGAEGFQYVVYVRTAEQTDGSTLLAATITSSRDAKNPLEKARKLTREALASGFDRQFAGHRKWWGDFWNKSSVTLPDEKIWHHYNLVQYFYGAASRRGSPPMSLQGVWTADAGGLPPWHGDYHHDLNTQLTYWAYLASGRFEEGLSFIDFMWTLKPIHENWAKTFWDVDGFVVPGVMALDGKPMGSWFQYTLSPTMGAWVAQSFYWHWRYTMDPAFLEDRAYPYCRGIAEALEDLLTADTTGKLKLPLSSSPEIHNNSQAAWLKPNSNFDLALIRWIFGANAEMAEALGKDKDADHWKMQLGKMDDFAVSDSGELLLAPGEPLKGSHRHFSHLMAIYPLGCMDIEGSTNERRIIKASLDQIDRLGTKAWCGYSFAWMACMRARAGQADRALQYLSDYVNSFTLRNGFHCNGEQTRKGLSRFHYRPFTLEGNFAAGQAVHEMLLQTWGGRVRVFPAVPNAWQDVLFSRLRGEGGFIVSAIRQGGKTRQITIVATVNGNLRLKDPFGGKPFDSSIPLKQIGDDRVCAMKAGEVLTLQRTVKQSR